MKEKSCASANTALQNVTPLPLAGPLQRPVNRGQGARGMDERDTAQGEPVRHEAGKDVGAPLALALGLGDGDKAGRYSRLPLRFFQQLEVVGLAQFHLERQGLGRRHGAADDTTRRYSAPTHMTDTYLARLLEGPGE
jgi:hypothetical protein